MNRPSPAHLLEAVTHAFDRPSTGRAAGWTPSHARFARIRPTRPHVARRVIAFLLLIPMLIGVAAPAPTRGDELSDAKARQKALVVKIAEQRQEVTRLKRLQAGLATEISATADALDGISANLTVTKKRVARLTDQIAQVRAIYLDLVAQVKELDAQIVILEAEQRLKEISLKDSKEMLALRLREAYRTDRTPVVQQILSAGSIADVFEDVGSYLDFGTQDRDLALRIQQDQATLVALHETLTEARTAKSELRTETLAQKKQLDVRMKDLKAARARLAGLQKETRNELAIQRANWARMQRTARNIKASMARDEAAKVRLAGQIKSLIAAQVSHGNIPSAYNGTLLWPMRGNLTQEFGCTGFGWEPARGNCAHFHEGIDLAAPMYTPIRASGAGTVVFAGPNPYDANPKAWIVIIAHSGSLQTWYAHLDNGKHPIAVSAGQTVVAGQVIAYEGMTGRTTGPHLHWAVMFNGAFTNPRQFT